MVIGSYCILSVNSNHYAIKATYRQVIYVISKYMYNEVVVSAVHKYLIYLFKVLRNLSSVCLLFCKWQSNFDTDCTVIWSTLWWYNGGLRKIIQGHDDVCYISCYLHTSEVKQIKAKPQFDRYINSEKNKEKRKSYANWLWDKLIEWDNRLWIYDCLLWFFPFLFAMKANRLLLWFLFQHDKCQYTICLLFLFFLNENIPWNIAQISSIFIIIALL